MKNTLFAIVAIISAYYLFIRPKASTGQKSGLFGAFGSGVYEGSWLRSVISPTSDSSTSDGSTSDSSTSTSTSDGGDIPSTRSTSTSDGGATITAAPFAWNEKPKTPFK